MFNMFMLEDQVVMSALCEFVRGEDKWGGLVTSVLCELVRGEDKWGGLVTSVLCECVRSEGKWEGLVRWRGVLYPWKHP